MKTLDEIKQLNALDECVPGTTQTVSQVAEM